MTPANRLSLSRNSQLRSYRLAGTQRCLAAVLGGMLLSAGPQVAYGLCLGELERSKDTRQRIDQEWPLRSSGDEATQYIQKLGVRLARYSTGGDTIPWRFFVVRNLSPNAFSIGAGTVYVTEGAITFARNESELAAIIAHELGHELAGHFCSQATYSGSPGFSIFFLLRRPPPNSKKWGPVRFGKPSTRPRRSKPTKLPFPSSRRQATVPSPCCRWLAACPREARRICSTHAASNLWSASLTVIGTSLRCRIPKTSRKSGVNS